jgi:hypothetical protein
VTRPEPFVSHAGEERISSDEEVLPLTSKNVWDSLVMGKWTPERGSVKEKRSRKRIIEWRHTR